MEQYSESAAKEDRRGQYLVELAAEDKVMVNWRTTTDYSQTMTLAEARQMLIDARERHGVTDGDEVPLPPDLAIESLEEWLQEAGPGFELSKFESDATAADEQREVDSVEVA